MGADLRRPRPPLPPLSRRPLNPPRPRPAAAAAPAAAPPPLTPAPKPAAKKAKRKAATTGGGAAVTIKNSRAADLIELQVAPSGSIEFKTVLRKLKAGKSAGARVPKTKDCTIDLHATFADGQTTEADGVDVCKTRTLNLTDCSN